ncbi:hypothetical protein BZARG_1146 [Bizionia argentinensis JUB59]|uniref:Uncharacterized protein n=1 Tax=Bizionia argentinensis JUB59 TaxID=1046627 RepID=G2EEP4_9FLAO|nr:hypothetical protein [Bizionia argentinensis]EGV43119.1 hypothetical protein BZARG_1146 [Bizionia argentinensis JUB59]
MSWYIFIPIFVGALGGYLLARRIYKKQNNTISADVWRNKVAKLQNDLKMCQASKRLIPFNAPKAQAVFGKKVVENDLTIIKGIDSKIAVLLNYHHIKTWKDLSETCVETCREILDSGGDQFTIYNPGTWSEQAKLAYEDNWKVLLEWQKELDGNSK